MKPGFLLGSLAVFAAAGCSETTLEQYSNARVDTVAGGRVYVANTGAPAWTPETAWKLEEDLRLGAAQSEGNEAEWFARIMSLTTDSRGRIYVLDYPSGVSVFHPTGAFSHSIGSDGRGPGEFAGAVDLTVGPGDTLWVTDPPTGRYSLFAPDGTFARIQRMYANGYDIDGTVLNDGSFVDWNVALPEGAARVTLQPVRSRHTFDRVDSLPPLEFTQELKSDGTPQPFFSGMLTGAVDRNGSVWFAHTREYRVYRRNLLGDTTLVCSLPAEAGPVGDAERDKLQELLFRAPPERLSRVLAGLPDNKPIVSRIVPDNAGHFYVFADVAGVLAGSIVDVFRDNGVYLGRMTLPSPVSLFPPPLVAHATADHLLVVTPDELDVPYVSRLRVVRSGE